MQIDTIEGTTTASSTRWSIDGSHTNATFSVRHLMISNVRGEFQKIGGLVTLDPARPTSAKVEVSIDVASLNTRDAQRDAHLKSADFFDVEKFPVITFASTTVRRTATHLELVGTLTIHGVAREVVLAVTGPTAPQVDPWGNVRVGASASTQIKRSDFGMIWNSALETGGVLVGDEVTIQLDVELVRQK